VDAPRRAPQPSPAPRYEALSAGSANNLSVRARLVDRNLRNLRTKQEICVVKTRPPRETAPRSRAPTRRYIDEQAIWTVMRFAGEPSERVKSRQISRVERDDPRGPFIVEKGPFDQFLDDVNDPA